MKLTYTSPVTATEHSYTTSPDQELVVPAAEGVLSGASGPDGGSAHAEPARRSPIGSVTLDGDGSFTYTPAPGHVGGDYFDYQVTDPAGSYAAGHVMLTIADPSVGVDLGAGRGWHLCGRAVGADRLLLRRGGRQGPAFPPATTRAAAKR